MRWVSTSSYGSCPVKLPMTLSRRGALLAGGSAPLGGYSTRREAALYDWANSAAGDVIGTSTMRERASRRCFGHVLVTACGSGLDLPFLAEQRSAEVSSITGVDSSSSMLELAQPRAESADATLLLSDLRDLDFEDASFDSVLDVFGLCQLLDPQRALLEMERVLKKPSVSHPGGAANLVEHTRADGAPLLAAYQDATAPAVAATGRGCQWNQRVSMDAREAGFDVTLYTPRVLGLVAELQLRPSERGGAERGRRGGPH